MTDRIEQIFRDARELQASAAERLDQGDIRDAAENAWGAAKRATDALILARTGKEPERTPEAGAALRMMASQDRDVRRARLVRRYHSRQVVLHVECFYNGLCEPLDETERRIRETAGYIQDAQRLAARELLRTELEQRKLDETPTQPPEDGEDPLKNPLEVLLGVDINRILKFQGDPPVYRMDTNRGNITLGKIGKTYRQATFRKAVRDATKVVIPKVPGPDWRDLVQAIRRLCEDVGVEDPRHPVQETKAWLREYLACRGVTGREEWENAARRGFPFLRKGHILISLRNFREWLEVKQGRALGSGVLTQAGAERTSDNVWTEKARSTRSTRSFWVLPEEFQPPRRDAEDQPGEPGELDD